MTTPGHGILGALNCCDCMGHLTINDVLMHTPAFCVIDLIDLWMPPPTRGDNVPLPRRTGTLAKPVYITETDVALPIWISGACDKDGDIDSDGSMMRLQRNLAYLTDNVMDPTGWASTKAASASLLLPDGITTIAADVQPRALTTVKHTAELLRAVLDIRIPAGRFS